MTGADPRSYPDRPIVAASAAVFRAGRLLVARRGRPPMEGLWSLPGGAVELGETLAETVVREVREEVGIDIRPVGLAGHVDLMRRDGAGRLERHFVILCLAAQWVAGEPTTGPEASAVMFVDAADLAGLATTDRLPELAAAAARLAGVPWA